MGIAAVLGLVIGITTTSWTGSIEQQSGKRLFAGLKVGQPVTLMDVGAAYEVRALDEPFPAVEEVAEVGLDYLVIKSGPRETGRVRNYSLLPCSLLSPFGV